MTRFFSKWTLMTFVLTMMSSPLWPPIPGWGAVLSTGIIVIVSSVIPRLRRCFGMAIAVSLILTHCQLMRVQKHAIFQSGMSMQIQATVKHVFAPSRAGFRGQVKVIAINQQTLSWWQQPTIKLLSPIRLYPGQQVHFSITVKPIYGQLNSVGFDYEKYAVSQGWVAQGRVISNSRYQILTKPSLLSDVYQKVSAVTEGDPAQGMILALLFGDRSLLTTEQWRGLRNSGLSHLVAISGLHIGIAFGFGFLCGQLVSRCYSSLLWTPWWLGLCVAGSYAWLAGFTIPTMRAMIMCLTMVMVLRLQLQVSTIWRLLFVLAVVFAVDPFASYSGSFWLSFGAVVVILYLIARPNFPTHWWQKMVWLQVGISLCLLPLSIWLFNGISYVSLLLNLIFIPWFSYVVVPLLLIALLALVSHVEYHTWIWQLGERSLSPILYVLDKVESGWLPISDTVMWLMIASFIMWRLRDVFTPHGVLFIIALAGAEWFYHPQKTAWQVDVFDVGHGLATMISQGNKALIFDTGASWRKGSMAQNVILPMLTKRGLQLDAIIVSHFDNDHSGGLVELQRHTPNVAVYSSQAIPGGQPCIRGRNWWWGALHIEVLWPPNLVRRAYNQHSCVIRVRDLYGHALLMTGDVDAVGEWLLVRHQPDLTAQVMVVPHHGSNTSSTQQLITKVHPKWALASVNKGSHWGLPSPVVVQRYRQSGAIWLDTGESGQISGLFSVNNVKIMTKRSDDNQRWYRQMLRNGVE